MAYDVKILPTTEIEAEGVVEYLSGFGMQPARRFVEEYRHQLELLASDVIDYGLCKLPEAAKLGYHACRVNSYIMLYYFEGDAVVIAHVFHQRQDYARLV